jgi:sugar phosphate permease
MQVQNLQNKSAAVDSINAFNESIGKYRWTICALLFFATTINYLDRAVISLLKGDLEKEFNWTETDYSNIVIAFQLSYAVGMIGVGRFIDKVGTKTGYAVSLVAVEPCCYWACACKKHIWFYCGPCCIGR